MKTYTRYTKDWKCPNCGSEERKGRALGLCAKCYHGNYLRGRTEADPLYVSKEAKKRYYKHKNIIMEYGRVKSRRLKWDTIKKLGGQCACCGCKTPEFLTVDHVNGDGAKHRDYSARNRGGRRCSKTIYRDIRREGYPRDKYRVLCISCNFSIGVWGYCPHTMTPDQLRTRRAEQGFDEAYVVV